MIPFKAFTDKTISDKPTELHGNVGKGYGARIQAVRYSSKNPSDYLYLYDADDNEFMFSIPGQGNEKTISLETPVTVKLPIKYIDTSSGDKQVIVFGEAEKISRPESNL